MRIRGWGGVFVGENGSDYEKHGFVLEWAERLESIEAGALGDGLVSYLPQSS